MHTYKFRNTVYLFLCAATLGEMWSLESSCFELNILIILALSPELHYQQSEQVYEANGGEIRALFFLKWGKCHSGVYVGEALGLV